MKRTAGSGRSMTAPSSEVMQTPTTDDLVQHVREGVEALVRDALAEADRLREQADEKLESYDAATGELTRLRLELHALKHDLADLPARVHIAALDGLVPDSVGENAEDLQNRYVQARERAPVVEARIARLADELAAITAGGSRPAKVRNERFILLHNAREPAMDTLNDAAKAVEDLCESLPDVVTKASEDLIRERNTTRTGMNQLWGQAKAAK